MVQWSEGLAIFVPCVVELICAMFLVLLGCGSTVNWPQEETAPTVLTISLSFGFLNAFLGNISTCFSGGFFNPAITASLVTTRTMPVKTALCFILAQLLGAVIGASLLYFIVPSESHEYLGMTLVKPVSCLTGCGVEVLMTTVVTLTVLHTSDGGQRTIDYSASVVIGLAVSVCHLFGFPITGCGINPARSFGPAVIMNKWRNHWVYWAGPIIGAQLAAAIHHLLNNFPVTTVNELVVSGRQLTNKAVSAPLEPSKSENHPPTPTQVTGQADSPCELTTSVMSSKNFTKTCLYLFVLILGEPRAETVGHRKSFNTRNNMQAKKILILLPPCHFISRFLIDLSAVMCLVTWTFNESEACVDLVTCMIQTSLLFLC